MAMRSVSFLGVFLSFFAAVVAVRAEAVNYTVGDMTGWTVPLNSDFYDKWNDNKVFTVGDRLIFNWTGDNNVVEVTKAEYDICANVTVGVNTTSPAIFNLTTIGDHHFISTVRNNCFRSQKLEIKVNFSLPSLPTPTEIPMPDQPARPGPPPVRRAPLVPWSRPLPKPRPRCRLWAVFLKRRC